MTQFVTVLVAVHVRLGLVAWLDRRDRRNASLRATERAERYAARQVVIDAETETFRAAEIDARRDRSRRAHPSQDYPDRRG